jgi:hypothetical protein
LTGYLVRKERLDAILDALGLVEFPAEGLVIGRVVDHITQPAAGVTVSAIQPSGDPVDILYLNQDFTLATTGPTESTAYFAATAASFNSIWSASHPDGREQAYAVRGGQIQGKVSVILLELEEPLQDPR